MDVFSFFQDGRMPYILPFIIFFSRKIDVSIGTVRVIFVSRGYKFFAAFFGFFEVLIWIVVISQILRNLAGIPYYISYAAGFAAGNYIGMLIEEKIALGVVLVRVFAKENFGDLVEFMKDHKYGATLLEGQGVYGATGILYTIIPRGDLPHVMDVIKRIMPQALFSVEDVRYISRGHISLESDDFLDKLTTRPFRKGK
jgi:uncharacterized protein YebE (UPF0316 family)